LVPITMKSAAKCDKQCELQNSANHQILERARSPIEHVLAGSCPAAMASNEGRSHR